MSAIVGGIEGTYGWCRKDSYEGHRWYHQRGTEGA